MRESGCAQGAEFQFSCVVLRSLAHPNTLNTDLAWLSKDFTRSRSSPSVAFQREANWVVLGRDFRASPSSATPTFSSQTLMRSLAALQTWDCADLSRCCRYTEYPARSHRPTPAGSFRAAIAVF